MAATPASGYNKQYIGRYLQGDGSHVFAMACRVTDKHPLLRPHILQFDINLHLTTLIYHIPLERLQEYKDHNLVVRSKRPPKLLECLDADEMTNLAYVQLHSLPTDIDGLVHWADGLGIEIALNDPGVNFPQLYHYVKLLDNHPVRVSLPVVEGFHKAVKLALALQFSVKLDVGQPSADLIENLARVLEDYLHRSTVGQPIEYFHSLLMALCWNDPADLWKIQEEDPARVRYIDEQGEQQLPGKLAGTDPGTDAGSFIERWCKALIAERAECGECAFFPHCRGYFKWPRRDYDCAGVKTLFGTLQQAAAELRRDLASATVVRTTDPL